MIDFTDYAAERKSQEFINVGDYSRFSFSALGLNDLPKYPHISREDIESMVVFYVCHKSGTMEGFVINKEAQGELIMALRLGEEV